MIAEQLEKVNNRERWLILGAVVAVVWVLFDSLIWQPGVKQRKALAQELDVAQNEQRQVEAVIEATRAALENDPNRALRVRRKALRDSIAQIQQQIEQAAGRKVSATGSTPGAVEFLLSQQPNLKLLRLEKRTPEAVRIEDTASLRLPDPRPAADAALKRHPVEVHLRGHYRDINRFVQDMAERHPDVAFEKFDLASVGYPDNELVLTLALFSYDSGGPPLATAVGEAE